MIREKKRKISAIGIFKVNMISVDDQIIEWIDAKDWSLADVAKLIGIDFEHAAKAQITLELMEGPCEICGKPTDGSKICEKCGKMICDGCSKIDLGKRYCPPCFNIVNATAAYTNHTS